MGVMVMLIHILVVKHIPAYIQNLIQKYIDGKAVPEEKDLIDKWFHSFSPSEAEVVFDESTGQVGSRVKMRLDEFVATEKKTRFFSRGFFLKVSAAVFLISFSVIAYFLVFTTPTQKAPVIVADGLVDDIAPGGQKATLTLGDGTVIALDDSTNGALGKQGNTKIIKINGGLLKYKKDGAVQTSKETVFNSIVTPKGGQYQVELADGTNVWLNSASSIRFPTEFTDKVRSVEITGEAYFEVAHNASKPFKVKIKDMYINVLGTEFDVMAYDNENTINTVLLGGSLKVDNGKISKLLNPGDKAVVNAAGAVKIEKNADIEETVAWKNGKFVFNSADLHSIMRQVERWYDVDVNFEKEVRLHFTGQVSRGVNVSELLRKLELTNEVHFRIEKKKITVLL